MKRIIILLTLLYPVTSFAQSNVGLIVGNGVRIRCDANVKSKEVSKVYGLKDVTILEETDNWDDLGKNEMCSRYKWVKVKWHPDSIGWVYGKYCFKNDGTSGLQTNKTRFEFNGSSYQLQIYENYEYPVGDEEGLTGCNNTYHIYLYEEKTSNYYPIADPYSKKSYGETSMVFYSNEGVGESIKEIKTSGNKIMINTFIGYQEGNAEADYVIQWINDQFEVTSYKKGETKY